MRLCLCFYQKNDGSLPRMWDLSENLWIHVLKILTTLALHPWFCFLRPLSPPSPRSHGHPNQLLPDLRGIIDLSPVWELYGWLVPETVESLVAEQAYSLQGQWEWCERRLGLTLENNSIPCFTCKHYSHQVWTLCYRCQRKCYCASEYWHRDCPWCDPLHCYR